MGLHSHIPMYMVVREFRPMYPNTWAYVCIVLICWRWVQSGRFVRDCIASYPSAWVMGLHSHHPNTLVYGIAFPDAPVLEYVGLLPICRSTWVFGNAFAYTQVLGHMGLHPHIPKYLGTWDCMPIYVSIWAHGNAFPHTHILGYMLGLSPLVGVGCARVGWFLTAFPYTQVLGYMVVHSHIPNCLGVWVLIPIHPSTCVYWIAFPYYQVLG
jgi:hypothetical protein